MPKYICPIDKQEFLNEEELLLHLEEEHGLTPIATMSPELVGRMK